MRLIGVDPYLEEQADRILAEDRARRGAASKEDGYLTDGQMDSRRQREVYNKNGVPESSLYSGLFRRAYNPLIGKRGAKPSSDE